MNALCASAMADAIGGSAATHGNSLNPQNLDPATRATSSALSTYRIPGSHSPSGLLYCFPPAVDDEADSAGSSTWNHRASIEVGILGGDAGSTNALSRQYKDLHDGVLIDRLSYSANKDDEARYVEVVVGGVSRKDQYYGLVFGRYNDYKISLNYDSILHTFTTARSFWQGIGTDRLSLPAGFSPAGTSFSDPAALAALSSAANSAPETNLDVERKKASLSADVRFGEAWSGYLSYSLEKRDGARPFGGGFWFPLAIPGYSLFPSPAPIVSGSVTQTVEPIEYRTHDLTAGMKYADRITQFNLSASVSLFRNANRSLTWENPFDLNSLPGILSGGAMPSNAGDLKYGQFALAPDNNAYNLKGEFARSLPWLYNGGLSATFSISRMRQNDDLLAPTPNSGLGGGVDLPPEMGGTGRDFTYSYSNWNTTAALSRSTADATIDTRLLDLNLTASPVSGLSLRAKGRYYETENHTDYTAYNPLTGQYGYLQMGGGHGVFIPTQDGIFYPGISTVNAVGNTAQAFQYRNIPFEGNRLSLGVEGDYRLRGGATLNFGYEREDIKRHYREREDTWEDKIKLGLTARPREVGTLRMTYRYGDRRGGDYNPNPYIAFNTMSLPGYVGPEWPFTLSEFRMLDLVDRKQHVFNARLNAMLRRDLDAGVMFQYKLNDYPTETYGQTGRQPSVSMNLDVNYSPSPEFSVYGFYSHERSRLKQTGIAGTTLADPATGAFWADPSDMAGGNIYPFSNAWSVTTEERGDVLGLGGNKRVGRYFFDLRYNVSRNRTSIGYDYATVGGAVQGNPYLEYAIGSAYPDLAYTQQILETSVAMRLSRQLSTRLFYRFENTHIDDWHYQGLNANPMVPSNNGMGSNGVIFVDGGPQNTRVGVVGVFLQYRL